MSEVMRFTESILHGDVQHQKWLLDEAKKFEEKTPTPEAIALGEALKALCLTRDYVGPDVLPAMAGWSWFDAANAISRQIPTHEWVKQFSLRVDGCPQCKSDTGIIQERAGTVICEDCGWPECDFAED